MSPDEANQRYEVDASVIHAAIPGSLLTHVHVWPVGCEGWRGKKCKDYSARAVKQSDRPNTRRAINHQLNIDRAPIYTICAPTATPR